MATYKKPGEDRGLDCVHNARILEARERELPPLPDDSGCSDEEMLQLRGALYPNTFTKYPLKSSPSASVLFPPSLDTPSKHDLVFPIAACTPPRSSSLRPKLHLDTGWDAPPRPAYLQENHSAGDLTGWRASRTSPSTPSSSRKDSLQSTSASSQEKLLPYCSSPDHDSESEDLADPPYRPSASSIPYVTVTKPSSSSSRNNEAKLSCRFLSAVRLPLPRPKSKLSCLVQTKRAVNANSSIIDNIRAKPFIHSDPCNPLHGITVTVQRQRLVSEPMIMPLPELFARMPIPGASSSSSSPSASATSLLSVTSGSASRVSLGDLKLDKPLPTPTPSEEEDLHPTITPVEDPHPHPYLPTGDDLDSGEVPISIVVPAPGDEPTVVQDAAEADGDPFADVPADALSPTAADLNQDPYPDPDPDPDLDLEPELVEFKSQLSVTVTPATATRLHVLPARHPKRRKRYTNSVRLGTADASMRVSAVGGPSSLSDLG